jgi:group I intron endonuclease
MRSSVIYCIQNVVTKKVYVGSAIKGLSSRKYLHRRLLKEQRHHSKHLQRAWNKYGEGSFVWFVLEKVADKTKILQREQFWMDTLRSADSRKGYNVSPTAGNNSGSPFYKTESFIKKQRAHGLKRAKEMSLMASRPHSMERRIENARLRCKLTDDQVSEIRTLLANGIKQTDIGAMYGVGGPTISNIKRGRSLAYGGTGGKDFIPKMKMSKISESDRAMVREMYQTMTQVQIAAKTGFSQSVISNIVRQS